MKKWRLLLLLLPLVAVALYMRSLASWRLQKVFVSRGKVWRLSWSNDGKTLLVGHNHNLGQSFQLSALDAAHGFVPQWTNNHYFNYKYSEEIDYLGKPQFFASNTRILVNSHRTQTLDVQTGKTLWGHGIVQQAAISSDGKWFVCEGGSRESPQPFLDEGVFVFFASITDPPPSKKMEVVGKLRRHKSQWASSIAFSPNTNTVVIGVSGVGPKGRDTEMHFYDAKTRKLLRVCPDFKMPDAIKVGAVLGLVQWSHDGRYLLVSWLIYRVGANMYATYLPSPLTGVSLWRASDGKRLASAWLENPMGDLPFPYDSFEVQDDGRVLTVSADGRVFLDDLSHLSLKSKSLLQLPNDYITTATISPDGSCLVAGTQSGKVYRKRLK